MLSNNNKLGNNKGNLSNFWGDSLYIIHQMHAIGNTWLHEKHSRGAYAHMAKKMFTKGCAQCYCVYTE